MTELIDTLFYTQLNDSKEIRDETYRILCMLETNFKKSGILENGSVGNFTIVHKYREEFYAMEHPLKRKRRIPQISSTTVCDEIIDGYLIVSKTSYKFDDDYTLIKYDTVDGYYVIKGNFKGDKPNGMCIEKYITSDDKELHSKRYGNFTDGVRQGEFIVSCYKGCTMAGLLIYENYLNGALKRPPVILKFGMGGTIHSFEYSDGTYTDFTAPVVELSGNVAKLSINTHVFKTTYYFLQIDGSFIINEIRKNTHLGYGNKSLSRKFENNKIKTILTINHKIITHAEILDKKNDFIRLYQHDLYFHFLN